MSIELFTDESKMPDGVELYYDNELNAYYSTPECLAKLLKIHVFPIELIIKIHNFGKTVDVVQENDIAVITLLSHNDLIWILHYWLCNLGGKEETLDNALIFLELLCQNSLKDSLSLYKHSNKCYQRAISQEIIVANFLKRLHESVGDKVVLQKNILLNYRPDMMIYTPTTGQHMAVEVEPYERRRHGLQQAITYATFAHCKPYLVTYGKQQPCPKEQKTLAEHNIAWLHLQNDGEVEKSKYLTNFSMFERY